MKKARLKDVAERVGVSVATVSYVLNQVNVPISAQTKEKVLKAAAELNYTTNWNAKGMKTEHYNAVGVIVEDMRSFFISGLIDGICQYAEENGVRVLMCNLRADDKTRITSHNDLGQYSQQLTNRVYTTLGKQLDSLIYVGAFYRDVSGVFIPDGHRTRYVYAYGKDSLSVSYDDFQGAYLAVKHLLDKGHRRIGYIDTLPGTEVGDERTRAYRQAMAEMNLDTQGMEFCCDMDLTPICGQVKALLLSADRPTAFFINSDVVCGDFYKLCSELQLKIPDDVSVVGFDNHMFCAYMTPPLTSVAFPAKKMGYTVMACACEGEDQKGAIRLPCRLVERESVRERRENVP